MNRRTRTYCIECGDLEPERQTSHISLSWESLLLFFRCKYVNWNSHRNQQSKRGTMWAEGRKTPERGLAGHRCFEGRIGKIRRGYNWGGEKEDNTEGEGEDGSMPLRMSEKAIGNILLRVSKLHVKFKYIYVCINIYYICMYLSVHTHIYITYILMSTINTYLV